MHPQQSPTRIGWIGVGAMGAPMCANLLKAGHRVSVYDRQPARAGALRAAGAHCADSLRELAGGADVLFSMIFDDAGLRDIVTGAEGLARHARAGSVFVDMSTVSPAASAAVAPALAQRGIAYLRAPVSGAVPLAAEARLSTFVSGPRDAFERVRPLLECMTARQSWVGEADQARAVKLMINLLLYVNTATLGEALDFGARAGLDRRAMLDAIDGSIVACTHYRTKADALVRRDYTPVGPITLALKDLDLALDPGTAGDAALPIARLARRVLGDMDRSGLGQLDVAALADSQALLSAVPGP